MKLTPARRLHGRVCLPGDKSISHRAAIIAALALGPSRLANFSTSLDCVTTVSCLKQLGVAAKQEGSSLKIEGLGNSFRVPHEPLDCGNSGSTIRMLAGVLAGQEFRSVLTGDASLRSRPMERVVTPLERMGARIESHEGRPPLTINGARPLTALRYELPVASAQVKSSILLAGLQARGHTQVIEKLGLTRDHTERMLQWFGVPVESTNAKGVNQITLNGPIGFRGRDVNIPGDISSAAFFVVAASLLPNSALEIEGVGLNPTRTQFLSTLRSVGLSVKVAAIHQDSNELVGTVLVTGKSQGAERLPSSGARLINGAVIPQLIDELPLLAIVGSQLSGGIEIRDAAELRFKESDRIAATVSNLQEMGVKVTEFEDGLAVSGPTQLRGAKLDSRGDHRIAMAFTVAALLADGGSELASDRCVEISFPEFFSVMESLVER